MADDDILDDWSPVVGAVSPRHGMAHARKHDDASYRETRIGFIRTKPKPAPKPKRRRKRAKR